MDTVSIQLELGPQQYERLAKAARARSLSASELAQRAIAEWLEQQAQIERGRLLMRELGQGIGKSDRADDIASNHDVYLYGRKEG
jgi:hypothetical protein